MKKKLLFLVIILVMLFSINAQNKSVITLTSDPWPPFVEESNRAGGLSIEIIRAAFLAKGYEVKLEILPWARALQSVEKNTIDVLAGAWWGEERSKTFNYSDPFLLNKIVFVVRKGEVFDFKNINDLRGKTVGVIRDYAYSNEFDYSSVYTKEVSDDYITNLRKLLANRIDMTLEDEIVAKAIIVKNSSTFSGKIDFVKTPLVINPLHILISKTNPRSQELIRAFNEGLALIKQNGQYKTIMAKYGINE
jgi:polar amino acid transport system substrate-binding protein